MSNALKPEVLNIFEEIACHLAWHGNLTGIMAHRMLKNQREPYLYLLYQGEADGHYYVAFVRPDGSIQHQPFVVFLNPEGWCYENGSPGGPYRDASIDDVLHLIMECNKQDCTPLIKK